MIQCCYYYYLKSLCNSNLYVVRVLCVLYVWNKELCIYSRGRVYVTLVQWSNINPFNLFFLQESGRRLYCWFWCRPLFFSLSQSHQMLSKAQDNVYNLSSCYCYHLLLCLKQLGVYEIYNIYVVNWKVILITRFIRKANQKH